MSLHVRELLAAYHDDELTANRRHQVESHLQDCPACRAELDALEELSVLLKAHPVPEQTPPERFAAQVQLRLPHATRQPARQTEGQTARWAVGVPLALITAWAFLQAALWVASIILTADNVLGAGVGLFGSWIPAEGLFETNASLLLFNLILLVVTAILWSAWMAWWLAWKRNQNESSITGGVI